MKQSKVDQAIERLCQKGCQALWLDIATLDQGQPVTETLGLSAQEQAQVLREIKSIMAVYKGRCDLDS